MYSYLHTSCWRLSAHCKTFLDYKWPLIQEESSPTGGCLIIHLRRREFPSQRQWCLANQRRRSPKVSNLKDLSGHSRGRSHVSVWQTGRKYICPTGEVSINFDDGDIIIKGNVIVVGVVDDLRDAQSLLVGIQRSCCCLISHHVSTTGDFLAIWEPEMFHKRDDVKVVKRFALETVKILFTTNLNF